MAMATVAVDVTSRDSVFRILPLAQGYLDGYRAAACGLIYRFTRIVASPGSWGSSDAKLALDEVHHATHVAQVVIAHWLAVYAGLWDGVTSVPFSAVPGLSTSSDFAAIGPEALLQNTDGVHRAIKEGKAVPTPFALLAFVADWMGATRATSSITPEQTANIQFLIDGAECLRAWRVGMQLTLQSRVKALTKMFKRTSGLDSAWIMAVGPSDAGGVQTTKWNRRLFSDLQNAGHMFDPPTLSNSITSDIAPIIALPSSATMLEPDVVVVAIAGKQIHALLNIARSSNDAPLEVVAVNATVNAVINGLQTPPFGGADAVYVTVWTSYPSLAKKDVRSRVQAAYSKRFGVTPGKQQAALSSGSPAAVSASAASSSSPAPTPPSSAIATGGGHPGSASSKRQSPRILHSLRLFTKGPHGMALYLIPDMYKKMCPTVLDAILHFFAHNGLSKSSEDADGTVFLTRDGTPVCALSPAQSERGYTVAPRQPTTFPKSTHPVMQIPCLCLVLTKEDLLWIATVPDAGPRVALKRLWDHHHVRTTPKRWFDDEASETFVNTVCNRASYMDPVSGAVGWESGAVLELILRFDDGAAAALVEALDTAMVSTCVSCTRDEEFYFGSRNMKDNDCLATVALEPTGAGDLVPRRLREPEVLPDDDIEAWSEWPLRGLYITTAQIGLLFFCQDTAALRAMSRFVRHCTPKSRFNAPNIVPLVHRDKVEIAYRFSGNEDVELGDDARFSTLTAVSAPTLSSRLTIT